MSEAKKGDRSRGSGALESEQSSFFAWVISLREQLPYKVVGLIAFALAGGAIGLLEPGGWLSMDLGELSAHFANRRTERANLMFLQAVMCLMLALFTPKPKPIRLGDEVSQERRDLTERVCRRIQLNLVAVFLFWSVYYVVFGISLPGKQSDFDRVSITTLSSVTTLLVFWLYLELGEITVRERTLDRGRPGNASKTPHGLMFIRFVSIGVLLLFVVPAWFGFGKGLNNPIEVAEVGIATLSGVSLALVVGSLGSKHLNPGSVTLGALYLYAIMQPAAVAFRNPAVQMLATTLALPLKIVLWLVCVWAFTTGVLAEYAYEERNLIEKQERRRARPKAAQAPS